MPLKSKSDQEILQEYSPIVASMVRQIATVAHGFSREQLHSIGLVALLGAVRNRQHHGRVAFEAFARSYIYDAMLGEVRRHKNWLANLGRSSISNFARV